MTRHPIRPLLALFCAALPALAVTSEVRILNGVPALYVNGKLTSQVLAAPYRPGPVDFNDFRGAGIGIFDIIPGIARKRREIGKRDIEISRADGMPDGA